jgi:hypothetical protein
MTNDRHAFVDAPTTTGSASSGPRSMRSPPGAPPHLHPVFPTSWDLSRRRSHPNPGNSGLSDVWSTSSRRLRPPATCSKPSGPTSARRVPRPTRGRRPVRRRLTVFHRRPRASFTVGTHRRAPEEDSLGLMLAPVIKPPSTAPRPTTGRPHRRDHRPPAHHRRPPRHRPAPGGRRHQPVGPARRPRAGHLAKGETVSTDAPTSTSSRSSTTSGDVSAWMTTSSSTGSAPTGRWSGTLADVAATGDDPQACWDPTTRSPE